MEIFIHALVLGVTLAMDALSISISKALATNKIKISNALKISVVFGLFQAIMPLIGYLVGNSFYEILENYFGYISFAILAFLGGKMIYEHFKNSDETQNDIITFKELVFLGIATSIDALAAGFIFAGNNILEVTFSCLIIGITTFIICFFGYFFGCKAGRIIGDKGEIFGGIVLIILGIKFLVKCF